MNKSIKRIGCLLMSALTVASVCAMAACKEDKAYDTETRPVVFSTDPLDGNFNPFFATSATDVTIAGMTQVSMLTTDEKGNPKCGDDVPTVALSYKETMYNSAGNVTTVPADATKEKGGSTAYEFIIKNDMKFSNGSALTIKDVLFNLYVYLDPMYMGSATIYSTEIKGLQAYKLQMPDAKDDSGEQDALFYSKADQRIADLMGYLNPDTGETPELTTQISKDIATVKELFREEVESDWAMYSGAIESYKEEYRFTEGWEIYYFNEGIIDYEYVQGKPQRDEDGKYLTNLDAPGDEKRAQIEAVKIIKTPITFWKTT